MKNKVYELILPFTWDVWAIRVWWEVEPATHYAGHISMLKRHLDLTDHDLDCPLNVCEHLAGLSDGISAVEVLDKHTRQGMVFYPDWK